jgi:hypothetical protein
LVSNAVLVGVAETGPRSTVRELAQDRRAVWIPWVLGRVSVVSKLLPQFVWRRTRAGGC